MTLGEKQRLFMKLFGDLIHFVYANGMEMTAGEMLRSDEQAEINAIGADGRKHLVRLLEQTTEFALLAAKIQNNTGSGIRDSLHESKLAADFNLFIDGVYQTDSESYRKVGEFWESLHPLARWGGNFKKPDGNHVSLEHEGRM